VPSSKRVSGVVSGRGYGLRVVSGPNFPLLARPLGHHLPIEGLWIRRVLVRSQEGQYENDPRKRVVFVGGTGALARPSPATVSVVGHFVVQNPCCVLCCEY
jgi:hypothetical protein